MSGSHMVIRIQEPFWQQNGDLTLFRVLPPFPMPSAPPSSIECNSAFLAASEMSLHTSNRPEQSPASLLAERILKESRASEPVRQGHLDNLIRESTDRDDLEQSLRLASTTPSRNASTRAQIRDHDFFEDSEEVRTPLPSKFLFISSELVQNQLHTQTISLKGLIDSNVKWNVRSPTSASRHHFFSCVSCTSIMPDNTVHLNPETPLYKFATRNQELGVKDWLLRSPYRFESSGIISSQSSTELTISFVFLQPRAEKCLFEFSRIIHIDFESESGIKSSAFVGLLFRGKPSKEAPCWKPDLHHIQIQESIGKGAFALVIACSVLGLNCAMKIWRNDEFKQRNDYQIEVDMYSKLSHDRLIPFIGAHTHPEVSFLLMKRAPLTLAKHLLNLRSTRQSPAGLLPKVLEFAIAAAEGLEYLHSRDPVVLHRDLKSINIVLEDPFLYIIDLGLAGGCTDSNSKKYRIGTMGWRAPETLQGDYTPKCDVYSFGMLLYELATLKSVPNNSDTPPADLGQLDQHPFSELYARCTSKSPEKRPTMSEILEKLGSIRSQTQHQQR